MTETAHRELQPLRGNALEVAAYLRAAGIFFAFNHPFHFYQGQLPLERYLELLIDAAPAIETRNGAMLPAHNQLAATLARSRGKVVVGGSDAHTLRRVGTTWTAAPGATREEFLANVAAGRGRVGGVHGGTFQLAADIYGVIWQYWLSLAGLRAHEISVPRRILGASFSLATLPGEFVPLIVAARSKQREARWVASVGGGARPRVERGCDAAGRDRAGARFVSTSGSDRRVAITGIGIVSSLGAGREANWEHMVAGLCGLRPVTLFDVSAFRSQIAGEIDTFDLQARFTPYQRRRWSRSEQLGVRGRDRGVRGRRPARRRSWIARGSACCSAPAPATCCATRSTTSSCSPKGSIARRPTWIHHHFSNTPVDVLAQHFDLAGRALVRRRGVLVEHDRDRPGRRPDPRRRAGRRDLRRHRRAGAAHVQRLQRAAPDGSGAVQAVRQGAAGDEHRRGRGDAGARGHGAGAGARRHDLRRAGRLRPVLRGVSTRPRRSPKAVPIGGDDPRALDSAGVAADEVDHVNCHGTATPQNDRAEARGLHVVFGDRARRIPVNSIKSMVGHCLGDRRRDRGGGARADRQARRDSADDPPRHDRPRVRRRRRRQHRARGPGPLRRLDVAGVRRQRRGAGDAGGVTVNCEACRRSLRPAIAPPDKCTRIERRRAPAPMSAFRSRRGSA